MKRAPLGARLLGAIGLGLGLALGAALGPRAAPLGAAALLYVKLLKLVAAPLVFFAIAQTFAHTRIGAAHAGRLILLSTVNALAACLIALGLGHLVPVGRLVELGRLKAAAQLGSAGSGAFGASLDRAIGWISHRLIEPLLVEQLLYVVAAAIAVGLVARRLAAPRLDAALGRALAFVTRILHGLVLAVPLVMLGVVAKVAGSSGLGVLPALAAFVGLVALGIALQVLGWYALLLRLVARRSPLAFFRAAWEPLATSLSVGSSLATLPVTLRTLDEKLAVRPESARLAACVGTNLNHDGIILYEATAALFVAQVFGVALSLPAQLSMLWTSVLAAVGIAGVPEAGLITLSLVLGAAGLPLAAVPLLLPVDWLLGRLRATCNVASDLVVATLLDRRFDRDSTKT